MRRVPEREVFFYVDETAKINPPFAGVALALVDDPTPVRRRIVELWARVARDPRFQDLPSIKKGQTGFHFAEDHIEVRNHVLQAIRCEPFESYIAFSQKVQLDTEYAWYDQLLRRILIGRLAKNAHNQCHIVIEEHGETKARCLAIGAVVESCCRELETRAGMRFVVRPTIEVASKEEACLVLADYVCGSFREYWLKGRGQPGAVEYRSYKEISPRVRLAIDADDGVYYDRQNPAIEAEPARDSS